MKDMGILNCVFFVFYCIASTYLLIVGPICCLKRERSKRLIKLTLCGVYCFFTSMLLCLATISITSFIEPDEPGGGWEEIVEDRELEILEPLSEEKYVFEEDSCYLVLVRDSKDPKQISAENTTIVYDLAPKMGGMLESYSSRKIFRKMISGYWQNKYILHLSSEEDIQKMNIQLSRE